MKVIARPNRDWKRQADCHGCSTTVELELSDLTYVADQRDGDCAKWRCPDCHRDGYIAMSQIPPHLRSKVRQ